MAINSLLPVGALVIFVIQGTLGCCFEEIIKELHTTVLMNQVFISKQFELLITLLNKGPQDAIPKWGGEAGLSRCLPPYTLVGAECFYVVTIPRNWRNARRTCKTLNGGDLATPKDISSLRQFIVAEKKGKDTFWVGGKEEDETGGEFRWINSNRSFNAEGWKKASRKHKRDCLYISTSGPGQVGNFNCSKKKKFVCQIG